MELLRNSNSSDFLVNSRGAFIDNIVYMPDGFFFDDKKNYTFLSNILVTSIWPGFNKILAKAVLLSYFNKKNISGIQCSKTYDLWYRNGKTFIKFHYCIFYKKLKNKFNKNDRKAKEIVAKYLRSNKCKKPINMNKNITNILKN